MEPKNEGSGDFLDVITLKGLGRWRRDLSHPESKRQEPRIPKTGAWGGGGALSKLPTLEVPLGRCIRGGAEVEDIGEEGKQTGQTFNVTQYP